MKELVIVSSFTESLNSAAPIVSSETIPDIQANRSVVLDDLLESEKAHVAEIRGLLENFLEPLASSQL